MNETELKSIENLRQIQQTFDDRYVQPEDVAEITKEIIETIGALKDNLSEEIKENEGEIERVRKSASLSNDELSAKLKNIILNSEYKAINQIKEVSQRLSKEIQEVERSIPEVDLRPLENKINDSVIELEEKIANLPEELKPKEIRDKLESLKGDDRLDASAIKGLGKRFTALANDIVNRAISILDQRTSFLINKVSNLQTQVNNLGSGGGGGGNNLRKETPSGAVNDVNVTFTVSNEPFFININGLIYEVGDGLYSSYSGGTITLSSPVGTGGFIKSYY